MEVQIPKSSKNIISALEAAGFEAYLVGGCVRDYFLGRKPQDWDVATSATPEEIQKIFPDSVYENKFGTVGVKVRNGDETEVIEVTTFRFDGKYSDSRHPDEVKFAKKIEDDLARRDFTVNAMALKVKGEMAELVDPFGGIVDLKNKIIRAVGDADLRFKEDALRLMRAVRFVAQLNFTIEEKTAEAIKANSGLLEKIAEERIRDEFIKIIMSPVPSLGIRALENFNLLKFVMPELREGIGCGQNKHHIYTVFDHNLLAVDYSAKSDYALEVRLASLLHDIAKPRTKYGEGLNSTFHAHEVVGAKMTLKILDRLCFSKKVTEYVAHLVRMHLFYYNVGEVTEAGVRRFLQRVGPENIDDLIKVREADRIGSGVPKAVPYKLRHLLFMIEKVKRDPISAKMVKINGADLMNLLKIPAGPRIGQILSVLLEEVINDPEKNTKEWLEKRALELSKLSEKELIDLTEHAKKTKDEFEGSVEAEIKKKFYVK